jgi:hypothetical protein
LTSKSNLCGSNSRRWCELVQIFLFGTQRTSECPSRAKNWRSRGKHFM